MRFFNKIKILGIDDSDIHQGLYESIFNEGMFGDFNFESCDGEHALNGIKPSDYDVILLDWTFDTVNKTGADIAKRIREELKYSGPIIFITAHEHIVKKLSKEGEYAIKKVPHPKKLTQFIRDVIEGQIEVCKKSIEDISNYKPQIEV